MLEDRRASMETPHGPIPATSSASESAQEKPGFRTKTIATRITPDELREVEAAAEKSGKTLRYGCGNWP